MNDFFAQMDAPIHGMEIYAAELTRLINVTGEHDEDGHTAHERFAQVCDLANLSFPHGAPSKEEVQANPATQPLMIFLLAALRSYRMRTLEKKLSTAKRREILAFCLGLDDGKRGGNTRGRDWNAKKREDLLCAFVGVFFEKHNADSWKRAFVVTYEKAFGADTKDGRSAKQSLKNRIKLECLLAEHGYGAQHFQVNFERLDM